MALALPSIVVARRIINWDKVGISLSSICMIHCLMMPLLIAAIPALEAYFHHRQLHIFIAAFVVPIAVFAFVRGFIHHREKRALILGLIGVMIILSALFLPEYLIHEVGHTPVTMAGSLFLISGHFLNNRLCRKCRLPLS